MPTSVKRYGTLVCIVIASTLLGSCNNAELENESARLELARVKGDLDQIFLSLRKLSELGDQRSTIELPKIEGALRAREAMLAALSDHDHERALIAADQLIGLMPGHKDATRTIRESGQIFWLLSRAQKSLLGVSDPIKLDEPRPASVPSGLSEPEKANWRIQTLQVSLNILGKNVRDRNGALSEETKGVIRGYVPSFNGNKLTDEVIEIISKKAAERLLARIEQRTEEARFVAITNARQFISKARTLDPQFKGSVQLDELLDKTHSAMVVGAAWRIYVQGSLAVVFAAQLHGNAMEGLQAAASSRYGSTGLHPVRLTAS